MSVSDKSKRALNGGIVSLMSLTSKPITGMRVTISHIRQNPKRKPPNILIILCSSRGDGYDERGLVGYPDDFNKL